MTEVQPKKRQACVRIVLRDGQVLEERCATQPRGEYDEPLEPEALEDKFHSLVSLQLEKDVARELWTRLVFADKEEDMSALLTWIWREVCPIEKPPIF